MRWYTYIQKIWNKFGFWGTQPRLVTNATEISLLRSSQQLNIDKQFLANPDYYSNIR